MAEAEAEGGDAAGGGALPRCVVLRNGVQMPVVGLGTFRATGEDAQRAVSAALAAGLRHIDTATIYKNESAIARALAASAVPRQHVFLTTKLSPYEHGAGAARAAVEGALARLGTQYADLVLIHWPGVARTPHDSPAHAEARMATWRDLEALYDEGRCRAIGVSNYEPRHLAQLLAAARVAPMVNQVEVHPRRQQVELRRLCREAGVAVVAYASLGCGDLLTHPTVTRTAAALGRSPDAVLLRWALQEGVAVIPKSVRPDRIAAWREEALLGPGAALPPAALAALRGMEDGHKYCWDPATVA